MAGGIIIDHKLTNLINMAQEEEDYQAIVTAVANKDKLDVCQDDGVCCPKWEDPPCGQHQGLHPNGGKAGGAGDTALLPHRSLNNAGNSRYHLLLARNSPGNHTVCRKLLSM